MIWLAFVLGFWELDLLKDTILIATTLLIPIFFTLPKFKTGKGLLRKLLEEVAGISAILIFYVNLTSFPIWLEAIFQVGVLILLVLKAIFTYQKIDIITKFCNGVLFMISISLLIYTTYWIFENVAPADWENIWLTFLFSIWFPLSALLFLYGLVLYMALESLFSKAKAAKRQKPLLLRVKLAIIVGTRGQLYYVTQLKFSILSELSEVNSYKAAASLMRKYRHSVKLKN